MRRASLFGRASHLRSLVNPERLLGPPRRGRTIRRVRPMTTGTASGTARGRRRDRNRRGRDRRRPRALDPARALVPALANAPSAPNATPRDRPGPKPEARTSRHAPSRHAPSRHAPSSSDPSPRREARRARKSPRASAAARARGAAAAAALGRLADGVRLERSGDGGDALSRRRFARRRRRGRLFRRRRRGRPRVRDDGRVGRVARRPIVPGRSLSRALRVGFGRNADDRLAAAGSIAELGASPPPRASSVVLSPPASPPPRASSVALSPPASPPPRASSVVLSPPASPPPRASSVVVPPPRASSPPAPPLPPRPLVLASASRMTRASLFPPRSRVHHAAPAWTHDGHPSSHAHSATVASALSHTRSMFSNALLANPTPSGHASYRKNVAPKDWSAPKLPNEDEDSAAVAFAFAPPGPPGPPGPPPSDPSCQVTPPAMSLASHIAIDGTSATHRFTTPCAALCSLSRSGATRRSAAAGNAHQTASVTKSAAENPSPGYDASSTVACVWLSFVTYPTTRSRTRTRPACAQAPDSVRARSAGGCAGGPPSGSTAHRTRQLVKCGLSCATQNATRSGSQTPVTRNCPSRVWCTHRG